MVTGLEKLSLLQSAPLQLRLVLVMTEDKSVSVYVNTPCQSSFISGSSGANEFTKMSGQTLTSAGIAAIY